MDGKESTGPERTRQPLLIHLLSSNKWGGPERYALDICRHFRDEGWKVAVVTRDAKAVDTLFRNEGIARFHAPLQGLPDIPSAFILARIIRGIPRYAGIIHVHRFRDAFTALLARKLSGRKDVKVISTRHTVRKGTDNALYRRIYRNLDAMLFVSRRALDRFLASWHSKSLPMPAERLTVLHNSLNIPSAGDSAPLPEKGPVTAMFHGPLAPGKGLECLIDALAHLKGSRMRLRIVGSGNPDYVDGLRRRAIVRGVMEMIDWKKHTDTPHDLIRESHFGVLPSVKEEAFGLVNIEYMANGRAQVSTSSGAQREYLTDGLEAIIVPPSDVHALAEAMRRLATDAELRTSMGRQAMTTYRRRLSWPLFAARLREIYLT